MALLSPRLCRTERAIYVSDGGDVTELKLLLSRRECVCLGGAGFFLFPSALTAEFHAKFVCVFSLSSVCSGRISKIAFLDAIQR